MSMTIRNPTFPFREMERVSAILPDMRAARVGALDQMVELARANGDDVSEAYGVSDVIHAIEIDEDMFRGFIAMAGMAVCAAFAVGLGRRAVNMDFGVVGGSGDWSWSASIIVSLATWFAVSAVAFALPVFHRLRHRYGKRLPAQLMGHAGSIVALGDRGLYLRDVRGDVDIVPYATIGGLAVLDEDSVMPGLDILGLDGTSMLVIDSLDAADTYKIAEAIRLGILPRA